ncbi:MAG: hypothetical protein K9M45_02715, partial [Kiritimatiellales bacterium]|nr:hypothetical protein [Kiritimatiellales bacterium]
MKIRRHRSGNQPRLWIMAGLMLTAMLLLVGELWRLQIPRQSDYESRFISQSIRRVRLPGIRGRVFDSNGVCLADNRPSYSIAIFMEEIARPGAWKNTAARGMELIETISDRIGLPVTVTTDDLMKHIHRRLPLPFIAWEDIDERTMARWAEKTSDLKGVDIYNRSSRIYPRGDKFSHLLGYVGRADAVQDADGERIHYYLPDLTGRSGLEALYNEFLRGEAGGKLMQIDVSGFRHEDMAVRSPKAGGDLQLTIDAEVQKYAVDALSTNRGAVVVLDPNNGDVLALASGPAFDANRIRYGSYYKRLLNDPDNPLFFRTVRGQYPPGSTFKPIVALAALLEKEEMAETTYTCHGVFQIGRRTMRCWIGRPGHGELSLRQALQHSCNVYMYHTGLEIGYEPIRVMASRFGLGEKTGIDAGVGVEKPGMLPAGSKNDTDLCNMTIGQGRILA